MSTKRESLLLCSTVNAARCSSMWNNHNSKFSSARSLNFGGLVFCFWRLARACMSYISY
ncbi:hypothetical protein PF005_g6676 [Phytophthora fragariae]|uniref:Uncharacterized protein n=2 Tax=Phytophthora TaxID=4783 RepID=A0A6A4DT18_9STRA|nr:hypothetical protein PF003_g118 [Phytophthora fragariae]KAE9015090.1 hypothetical protein PR001_g14983 [Phytophthora rubi]KAE8947011.1 hypothetical protein PF009_g3375 [Phytophthora fragariae]KAE9022613.1 hypothetical protein PF011_g4376 [Phytophthora fragariae]KAE9028480.1 hypothetical protein PR002_g10380 [Phytophthora rubi]